MPIGPMEALFAAFLLLLGALAIGMRLNRQHGQTLAIAARMTEIAVKHAPSTMLAEAPRLTPGATKERMRALWVAICRFAGYHSDRQSFYPLPPWGVLLLAAGVAGVAGYVAGFVMSSLGRLIFLPTTMIVARLFWRHYDRKRRRMLLKQFPDTLGSIVRSVRVGIPITETLRYLPQESPEPTAEEFGRVADRIRIGVALEQALQETAERVDVPEYSFFATAITLQSQTGGALTETLENLADVIRKRTTMRNRAYALAGEARTSAGVLIALPFIAAAALLAVNPAYLLLLFQTSLGHALLAAAAMLLTLGIVVMQQIINRSLS